MPRPGQTPKIQAGEGAEHGTDARLARTQRGRPFDQRSPRPELDPSAGQRQPQQPGPSEDVLANGDPFTDDNDGFDEALLAPTGRPDEPITMGAPFGPGTNFLKRPDEDDRGFALRVANELEGDPALSQFVRKLRMGG